MEARSRQSPFVTTLCSSLRILTLNFAKWLLPILLFALNFLKNFFFGGGVVRCREGKGDKNSSVPQCLPEVRGE